MKIKKALWAVALAMPILISSCAPDEPDAPVTPDDPGDVEITTSSVSITGLGSAKTGGNITSDGGQEILQRGVCWSASSEPSVSDKKTSDGTGIGAFTSTVTGLSLNATYFFRAYAITATDTTYGNEIEFSTTITTGIEIDTILVTQVTLSGTISEELDAITAYKGVCWDTIPFPKIVKNKPLLDPGDFTMDITGLTPNTQYYFRTFMILTEGDTLYSVSAKGITFPAISTSEIHLAAASFALGGGTLSEENGPLPFIARGICFSTSPNPDINSDTLHSTRQELGIFYEKLSSLTPASTYYVRAFATNEGGTSYGEEVTFTTTAAKKITFGLNMAQHPSEDQLDAYKRITSSMTTAVDYYDKYTEWRKHVTANYVPGVPTADANYEGWMRFGSNRSFMNVRTTLHELSHTVGIGTSSGFNSIMVDNVWTGSNGAAKVKELTGNPGAVINRYGVHIGPFGLNFDSEGTSDKDFMNHCLLLEAMRKDGL